MFKRKQEKHFEQVVRAYSGELYRFAYWLCHDRFKAEELVQETFARAWNNWEALRDPLNPKPWLLTILRNEHARSFERKQLDYVDEAPEDLDIPAGNDLIAQYELENLLAGLPLPLREPLLLQTLGGYSCDEIAEQLGTTTGAVMVRLTRARKALQNLLTPAASRTQNRSAS